MKKIAFLALMLLGLFGVCQAQVCKISESNDNVEIFSAVIEDGNTVIVTVSNDSKDISANVTVVVEVTYSNGGTKQFSGKVKAEPNQESIIRIPIPEFLNNRNNTPKKVVAKEITGTKCM